MLRKNYRLGYEGEMATGQELNMLMLEGYHVFHDFPADRFNIDHIVVSPNGVIAIETKAKSGQHLGIQLTAQRSFMTEKSFASRTGNTQMPLGKQSGRQSGFQTGWAAQWVKAFRFRQLWPCQGGSLKGPLQTAFRFSIPSNSKDISKALGIHILPNPNANALCISSNKNVVTSSL
ncbi:MAG: NERD domain-containing protein [Syntrophaceae bacterium]|nr:NERD domain-containing protein [Syntrophaceae bacterium]